MNYFEHQQLKTKITIHLLRVKEVYSIFLFNQEVTVFVEDKWNKERVNQLIKEAVHLNPNYTFTIIEKPQERLLLQDRQKTIYSQ